MPEAYYIIPMVAGPYSRANPQRPDYVDEIKCNWSGHNVDALGVYICLVNTTEAKHTDLASRSGVRQMPRGYTWDSVISTLPANGRNAISRWCGDHGIPYDSSETIGQLLMRVINSGLFELGNTALDTQFQNLSQAQKDKIDALCQKHGIAHGQTDTVRQISDRCGRVFWPGDDRSKIKVEEY